MSSLISVIYVKGVEFEDEKKNLSDFEIYGIGCRGEIFLIPILFQTKFTSIIKVFLKCVFQKKIQPILG